MGWKFETTSRYEKDFRKLDQLVKERTYKCLEYLSGRDDPRPCGKHKYGDLDCWYSYEIGRDYRVLYDIKFEERTILLARIGLHKIYDI